MREERLGRVLTFFGCAGGCPETLPIRWVTRLQPLVIANTPSSVPAIRWRPAVDARVPKTAARRRRGVRVRRKDRAPLLRDSVDVTNRQWKSLPESGDRVPVRVTEALPELTGPMSGIEFEGRPTAQRDAFVPSRLAADAASDHEGAAVDDFVTIVSVGGAPSFVQLRHVGVPVYLCA